MPGDSRSRDRYNSRDRAREHRRDRDRNHEYIRDRYEDGGEVSGPGARGKYRFRGAEFGYDSYDAGSGRDVSEDEDERRREKRERRERRRQREEERAYNEAVEERRRERSKAKESPATSPIKRRDRERDREGYRRSRYEGDDSRSPTKDSRKHQSSESTSSASHLLSADALAKLASENKRADRAERSREEDEARRERRRQKKRAALAGTAGAAGAAALGDEIAEGRSRHKSGARVVSGAYLEEGRSPEMNMRRRGGGGPAMDDQWKKEQSYYSYDGDQPSRWKFWANWSRQKRIILGSVVLVILLLAIIIPVAAVESQNKSDDSSSDSGSSDGSSPSNSNLDSISRDSIPSYAQGTFLDPFTWYDTEGFNLTFTNATVGGLHLMGLNSSWDDSTRANDKVPPLNEKFPYGSQPIRGVNIGGWLSLEPFIAPSLFEGHRDQVIDEWTLTQKLGSSASNTIEKHYAEFITESDISEIQQAGLDHVRIPYSYWVVTTYDGDPYVPKIGWRYLLRAIEWCRKYGLRVKLDLHGLPGSQNGWNHSGHQGSIGWLNGTDGELNRQRSLDIHDQLSQFFAQDRYKNIVTIYGLVNEPLLLSLSVEKVLGWTQEATELVRKNGVEATVVLHDGFLNLDKWDNMFKDRPSDMYLDTHQYTTFNTGEIVLNHTAKVEIICKNWYDMIQEINSTSKGWGPTICGEWSQADTDCAEYVNNVGRGTRWEGTYDISDSTAYCPTADDGNCSCDKANADPSEYSDAYKKWLQTYAEAQMSAFETAQGWFYWTWRTESAAQWSYRTAWKNGYMPEKAYSPSFKCGDDIPDFSGLGLPEYY
ncbi:glucan 1-3-beta-glucosidase D [Penicillium argentinense]|uniref:glucan 1,3-beta-glucosidase n=1 Tax=Penicillium argentinense TaxID=1131581 RepID=A0A9W9K2W9_9EURO|nr:glucan 1-3-beta-glucosidase D [Penicillium argentinense]KAJ5090152.1 glucan 1-3-beta-glucosidase D [Penicillium argentinense]